MSKLLLYEGSVIFKMISAIKNIWYGKISFGDIPGAIYGIIKNKEFIVRNPIT
jgi:hypothetical protein